MTYPTKMSLAWLIGSLLFLATAILFLSLIFPIVDPAMEIEEIRGTVFGAMWAGGFLVAGIVLLIMAASAWRPRREPPRRGVMDPCPKCPTGRLVETGCYVYCSNTAGCDYELSPD